MEIDFVLSQADQRPMYQQVMGHIKDRIAVGDWPEGAKVPSIRELAVALQVSVITIKRAYQELEYEGILLIQHGKGAFVAPTTSSQLDIQEQELSAHLTQAVKIAKRLELSQEELESRLRQAQEKEMETDT